MTCLVRCDSFFYVNLCLQSCLDHVLMKYELKFMKLLMFESKFCWVFFNY
jgi:hypothetical protein